MLDLYQLTRHLLSIPFLLRSRHVLSHTLYFSFALNWTEICWCQKQKQNIVLLIYNVPAVIHGHWTCSHADNRRVTAKSRASILKTCRHLASCSTQLQIHCKLTEKELHRGAGGGELVWPRQPEIEHSERQGKTLLLPNLFVQESLIN